MIFDLQKYKDNTAVITDDGQRLTYAEVDALVET